MPGRDRTGPMGEGPLTGGGFGPCAEEGVFRPYAGRRTWGRGGGRGRGRRNWYRATGLPRRARFAPQVPQQDEAQALEQEAQWLNEQLEAIKGRLAELRE